MHADELPISETLVRRLLDQQFPRWVHLPLVRVSSGGTENAIFRLGTDLALRLPLRPNHSAQVRKLHQWLPLLGPQLTLPVPQPVALGEPTNEFPSAWLVCRWLPGTDLAGTRLTDPLRAARSLAGFIRSLRRIDARDGPAPGAHNFHRGVPLAARDDLTRCAIADAGDLVDPQAVTAAWDRDLQAAAWKGPPVWIHGDLAPGNLLSRAGHIQCVIDWGGLAVGDPATDLLPAWNLLGNEGRAAFRTALDVDDATWARGRGLALSVALVALPYYADTNPVVVRWARAMISEVLADHLGPSSTARSLPS
jgi:aminoglycoside phosphotransferase (APT) family kinase protein